MVEWIQYPTARDLVHSHLNDPQTFNLIKVYGYFVRDTKDQFLI